MKNKNAKIDYPPDVRTQIRCISAARDGEEKNNESETESLCYWLYRLFGTDKKMKNKIKGKQKVSSGSLTLTYIPDFFFTRIPNKFSLKKWNKIALWNLANQLFSEGDRKILVL